MTPTSETTREEIEFTPYEDVLEETSTETFGGKALRRAKRYGLRGAESIAALPGDIAQTVRGLASLIPSVPEKKEHPALTALGYIPGSEEIRKKTSEIFPELEPQSRFEEIEDAVVQDFTTLALPIKGKIPFARSIGLSVLGNLGKEGVKSIGAGETASEATKLGLMFLGGMFGKGRGVNTYINNLYKKADKLVSTKAKAEYPIKKLKAFERTLRKGSITDAKKAVLDVIDEMKGKLIDGKMKINQLTNFDKDLNRYIRKAGKDATKRGYFKRLKGFVNEPLEAYGKKNPQWYKNWSGAREATKGIRSGENVRKFIKKNANLKNFTYAGAILMQAGKYSPGPLSYKIGAPLAAAAAAYGIELLKRVATNPSLRKYYGQVVKASLNENKAMLARSIKNLDRAAKKEFEEEEFPTFNIE